MEVLVFIKYPRIAIVIQDSKAPDGSPEGDDEDDSFLGLVNNRGLVTVS